jgi:hypothetical protein
MFALNSLVNCSSMTVNINNAALYDICQNQLKLKHTSFADINHIIS